MATHTIRLWGRSSGFHARKVIWALNELSLEYAITEAGFGLDPSEELLARNPSALAPVIDDGGVVVWESNVIVRYLCAAYSSGSLLPDRSLEARFQAEQWMDWNATTLWPAVRPLHHERARGQLLQDGDRAALTSQVDRWLDVLDHQLGRFEHLACDNFCMADIPAGLTIDRAIRLGLVGERPNICRWWSRLVARPAFPAE